MIASVTFTKESDDLFVIEVQGTLTFEDKTEIEKKARQQIDTSSKVKLLLLAEQFTGWSKEGDWGDLTFFHEYDPYIEKIAVVANEKWKDQLPMFIGAGRRQGEVKFFFEDEEQDAWDWLKGDNK